MLRRVVATPFIEKDKGAISRAEFIYSLSVTHDWFTPEETEELIDQAMEQGFIVSGEEGLSPCFDIERITPPEELDTQSLLGMDEEQSVMEIVVDRLVSSGYGKREAVAEVNRTHKQLGNVTISAAAIVVAIRNEVEVNDIIPVALGELKK